jgi:hypothetical protein
MFFSLLVLLLLAIVISLYTENQKKFEFEQVFKSVLPGVYRSSATDEFVEFLNEMNAFKD